MLELVHSLKQRSKLELSLGLKFLIIFNLLLNAKQFLYAATCFLL